MGNRKRSWSLSNQILLGIGLGVASGVFFGELMGVLGVIGPQRMDDGRVIPLVSYCAELVTRKLLA